MEPHLKPCPHCGSEARLNVINDDPEASNYQGNHIACEACGASTQLMFSTGEDCLPVLAELWNARHQHDSLRTAAANVIEAFEALSKTKQPGDFLTARSRCIAVMADLHKALQES